ncbi:MAG: DUF1415 domain-containing protein, partial [Proteobacteria bacterium]|nr:DUF1415 domain-containing protein [Pseudomonadota bacterium]
MSPVATTRAWLRDVVVGLDLCPFAQRPLEAGEVRFAVTSGRSPTDAVADLLREASKLLDGPDETTLLVAPEIGLAFEDFMALTWAAEALLED